MEGHRYNNQRNWYGYQDPTTLLQHYPQSLKKHAEGMDKLISQCKRERQECLSYIETLSRENTSLKNDIKRYRKERDVARQDLQNSENKLYNLRQDLERNERIKDDTVKYYPPYDDNIRKQQKIQSLEKELRECRSKITQLHDYLNHQAARTKEGSTPSKTMQERDERIIAGLRGQLQHTWTRLKETQAELDDTKTRLSKVMGDRLTDNNPNIADLSDKNRPIKLAERYAELYDNQWTDAFDVIEKYCQTEEHTVGDLRYILQDIMAFCKHYGNIQMENLRRDVAFSNRAQQEEGFFTADMNKQLKDFRKAMSSVALTNVYKMYISRLEQSPDQMPRRTLEITPYVKECVELCWLMVVQDPPVVLAPMAERGSALNTDLYKPYVRSGTHVEYVVWPALLLHEGGPVLAKGVAQGYGKQPRKQNVPPVNSRGKANEETGLGNGISRGFHNSSQNDGRDSQYDRYAQVGSSSGLVNRSSRNSDTVRDDRKRNQRVATIEPMQMASSWASK